MEEDLQHLIQAIIAYEENPCCPHAREHLRKIRLHCVCNYTPEQVQEATHEAYKQIRF